ncbi:MAG: DUF4384 domain-containing protein [SAR324 cluster bacterium]|nr:DUF4384 domain-containing protein [SAR324 cluster bacterium]
MKRLLTLFSFTLIALSLSMAYADDDTRGFKTIRAKAAIEEALNKPAELKVVENFKVEVISNKGKKGVIFKEGEDAEFFVRLNKPGFYYVVGHTKNQEVELSYLLNLHHLEDQVRFLQEVSPDSLKKWQSLGKFTVEPPFGLESLQVIASNKKIEKLPPYTKDEATGLYVISKTITEGIQKTRAFKPKKKKTILSAEAVILIETQPNK